MMRKVAASLRLLFFLFLTLAVIAEQSSKPGADRGHVHVLHGVSGLWS